MCVCKKYKANKGIVVVVLPMRFGSRGPSESLL